MPERIQRRRTKGWRAPEGAVSVSRPSILGNPFVHPDDPARAVERYRQALLGGGPLADRMELERYVRVHGWKGGVFGREAVQRLLADARYVMCWCREDRPCHSSVHVEIMNS